MAASCQQIIPRYDGYTSLDNPVSGRHNVLFRSFLILDFFLLCYFLPSPEDLGILSVWLVHWAVAIGHR